MIGCLLHIHIDDSMLNYLSCGSFSLKNLMISSICFSFTFFNISILLEYINVKTVSGFSNRYFFLPSFKLYNNVGLMCEKNKFIH